MGHGTWHCGLGIALQGLKWRNASKLKIRIGNSMNWNTNFDYKAVDLPWGSMKQKNWFWHFGNNFVLEDILQILWMLLLFFISNLITNWEATEYEIRLWVWHMTCLQKRITNAIFYMLVCGIPKVDKNSPKIPKIKPSSGIRRPGVGVGGCYQGGPWGLTY